MALILRLTPPIRADELTYTLHCFAISYGIIADRSAKEGSMMDRPCAGAYPHATHSRLPGRNRMPVPSWTCFLGFGLMFSTASTLMGQSFVPSDLSPSVESSNSQPAYAPVAQIDGSLQYTSPSVTLANEPRDPSSSTLLIPYWVVEERKLTKAQNEERVAYETLEGLIMTALVESPYVRGLLLTPRIRQQEADQSRGVFDPNRFANSIWSDRSDPVGSTLATGGASRLNETNLQNSAGIRKKNTLGGSLEASQDVGFRNNNSLFFVPKDQSDTKMLLKYTQPLMKGAGRAYNTSFIGIAQLQVGVAECDAQSAMQKHALEVTQTYWDLYYQRSLVVQLQRGLDRLTAIASQIEARSDLDSIRSQLARASSEVKQHQARLVRARAAVIQAESTLRAHVNAARLNLSSCDEIIPTTEPLGVTIPIAPEWELEQALQCRPDILRIRDEIKAANLRLRIAENELKPTLNLVTDFYVHGLRGNYNAADAFGDQFATGRPSYSGGVEYLRPRNQTVAKAIKKQRSLEIQQILFKLEDQLLHVSAEIQNAIAEVDASYSELVNSGQAATIATMEEVEHLTRKWINSPLLEPQGLAKIWISYLMPNCV